jgi:hypothetical protein
MLTSPSRNGVILASTSNTTSAAANLPSTSNAFSPASFAVPVVQVANTAYELVCMGAK